LNPLSILMFPGRTYPCSHAMLETVYTRIMPQRGHSVTWVMQSVDKWPTRGWELVEWNDTTVYLLGGDRHKGNLQKLIGRFVCLYRIARRIILNERVDIIQVRNDWIAGLIGRYVQRRWGIPFVYQVSFPVPEMQMYRGGWRKAMGLLTKRVQRLLLEDAALVLPISQWMCRQFEDVGIPASKMFSFPLGVDTLVHPDKVDGQQVRRRLELEEYPTLIYFGEMERARQLDFLLGVVRIVVQRIPALKLLMVGKSEQGDQDVEWLKSVAVELGISGNVIFVGYVPREDVPSYIAAADIGVSPIVPLPLYWISSPTKLVETMGMAKPVVANDIPEQELLLSKSGAGICTAYDEDAFADAIRWLLRHPEEAREMGKRGRKYVEEHRSYDILAQRIEKVYNELVCARGHRHL